MTSKLKVLFVGSFQDKSKNNDAVGGVMKVCRELMASDISKHVEWVLIDSTALSIPPPSIQMRLWMAARRVQKLLASVVWDEIDAVLIFSSCGLSFVEKGLMSLIAKGFGKPVVYCPRSGIIIEQTQNSRFMRKYVEIVVKNVGALMCQGKAWRDFYQELSGRTDDESFVVIPNWVNLAEVPPMIPKQEDDPSINILYLGWLKDFKGIFDLIEAVKLLNQEDGLDLTHVKFILCGSGEDHQKVELLIKEYGLEHLFDMRGWVIGEGKNQALQEADIYVHPSHVEGLPNALLEAMSMGLPPIATDVGAIPEVLGNPEDGILIPSKNPPAIKDALKELITNEEKRLEMGKSARKYIENNHNIDVLWPKIYSLFERLVRS